MRTLILTAILLAALPAAADTSSQAIAAEALKNSAAETTKALNQADAALADAQAALKGQEGSMTAEQQKLVADALHNGAAQNAAARVAAAESHAAAAQALAGH